MEKIASKTIRKSGYGKRGKKTYGNLLTILIVVILISILFSGIFSICSWDGTRYTEVRLTWNLLFNAAKELIFA